MTSFLQKIAVLMGGRSAEREVSLSSGRGVVAALREEGFEPIRSIPATIRGQQCCEAKPDAVFNALHGRFGEDGTVQGLLELMRMPYTHSGVLSSALAMHKERTKDVYRAAGLPVVKSIVVDRREAAAAHLMEPPYVVKPVNEGSSRRHLHHPQGRQSPAGGTGQRHLEPLQRDDGGGIRARPRTHRRGDGRARPGRDRDHHRTRIL